MSARITNVRPKPGFLMDGAGQIVPAGRNVLPFPMATFMRDGLANVASGRGTTVDKRSYNSWYFNALTAQQVEAAYRSNWLARKIVDIPAKDMTREGRAWQAEKNPIEALEAEEKRLQLWPKLLRCLSLARLYGGAALIPSVGDANLEEPLNVEAVKKGGLRWASVYNRYQLTHGDEILDPESEWRGMPEWFQITSRKGYQQKLHPSRVFAFVGQKVPEGSMFTQSESWFWGDSILQSIDDAVKDATAAANGFAALVDEAAVDVISIEELLDSVGTQEYEDRLLQRLALSKLGQSTHRTKLLDSREKWEQRQITWAGIPEVLMSFMELVAGAADIPVTRLLGQSPKGLQSTGKGEQQDYHDKVKADQDEILRPQLERVDELLIRSAMGSRPDDIYFEFNSLETPDEAKDAEIENKYAEIIKKLNDTGLFDPEALAAIGKNRMIESGRYPGCEAAFEEHPDVPEDEPDPDAGKTMAELAAEKAEALRSVGTITGDQATMLIADAKPRSLYVSRKLLNAAEFLKWAKGQGFKDPLPAGELHVTVCYSKMKVDWLKMGEAWDSDRDGKMTVPAGGARIVEPLGDKGAVVLLFNSSSLSYRHEQLVREGASHDFDDYQPHVTISWNAGDMDLSKVEPYRGKLVFGPEIFAEIDEDWAPPVKVDA
jgi:phage-related protein (TIGR01555 family)